MVRIISASKSKNHPCHFCHCSTSRAIDAIGGSVEVTPHHLLLSIEHFNVNDGRGKVNPPLRHEEVRKNLWSRWERIDVIASDHAPHTLSEKSQIFSKSPAGIPGVETMVPLCMAMVLNGKVSLESLIQKISSNPSAILGIPRAGFIKGNRADFALFPRQKQKIRTENLHSKCGWTPYEGFEGVFPEIVVMNGSCVFKRGEYFQRNGRWFPGRGYIHQDAT